MFRIVNKQFKLRQAKLQEETGTNNNSKPE